MVRIDVSHQHYCKNMSSLESEHTAREGRASYLQQADNHDCGKVKGHSNLRYRCSGISDMQKTHPLAATGRTRNKNTMAT